jgi:hypothetical protein
MVPPSKLKLADDDDDGTLREDLETLIFSAKT